jgi:hypothetical protein
MRENEAGTALTDREPDARVDPEVWIVRTASGADYIGQLDVGTNRDGRGCVVLREAVQIGAKRDARGLATEIIMAGVSATAHPSRPNSPGTDFQVRLETVQGWLVPSTDVVTRYRAFLRGLAAPPIATPERG